MTRDKQDKDNDDEAPTPGKPIDLSLGLNGVLSGLGSLLRIATEIADRAPQGDQPSVDVGRTGAVGSPKGLHAVYGVSVRVLPHRTPAVARFGNVRQARWREPVIDDAREPMADLFDEDDHYLVVAELPGVQQSAVKWTVRNGVVVEIRAESGDRNYRRDIELPGAVDDQTAMSCYENGVLEIKLWKQPRR